MKFFNWLSQVISKAQMSQVERYLAQSSSLADLERRQKMLQWGKVKF